VQRKAFPTNIDTYWLCSMWVCMYVDTVHTSEGSEDFFLLQENLIRM